jgi:hypothetical protein
MLLALAIVCVFSVAASNPAPPEPVPVIQFSAGFASDMILQQSSGPKGPAVYGVLLSDDPVSVKVDGPTGSYTVDATVSPSLSLSLAGNFTWRAELRPQMGSSDPASILTIAAMCPKCSSNSTLSSVTLERVRYGDVFFW